MSRGDSEHSLISSRNLHYRVPAGSFTLQCCLFELRKGEIVALVGLNGSGKTTFLRCLARSPTIRRGLRYDVLTCLSDPLYVSPAQLASLCGDVTVVDYYSLAFTLHGHGRLPLWSRAQRLRRVLSLLQDYDSQEHFAEIAWKQVSELSSGEKQRLLLADLLLSRKTILLLDEPAAHFDMAFELHVLEALQGRARRTHGAAVIVSHNIGLLRKYADRAYLVRTIAGEIGQAVVEETQIPDSEEDVLAWLEGNR